MEIAVRMAHADGKEGVAVVGRVIRKWRLQRGLRQEDLERATSIPQAYLSDIERGHIKEPGLLKMSRIVEALGHTLDELMAEVKREDVAACILLVAA